MRTFVVGAVLALILLPLLGGCTTSKETAREDTMTARVGDYPPAPATLKLKRAAAPPFLDASPKNRSAKASDNLGSLAADQLTTLLVNSGRFDVIERAQLDQLLKEQGLEGIVDPNELAQPNRVRGVDYLVIGKITNYRVKSEKSKTGFGLGRITNAIGVGEVKNDKTVVTVDCGVDLRVVDPTSGSVIAAEFGEYKRTDELKAFGVDVLGVNATAEGDMELSEDNQGKILRLALDQCMRKMLPKLDRALLARQG